MSIVQRLEAIFEAAKATEYHFQQPVADALHAIASHVEQLVPGASAPAGADVGKLEELLSAKLADARAVLEQSIVPAVHAELGKFQPAFDEVISKAAAAVEQHGVDLAGKLQAAIDGLNATVDQRVKELFGQLLAQATADEQHAKEQQAQGAPAQAAVPGQAGDPNAQPTEPAAPQA